MNRNDMRERFRRLCRKPQMYLAYSGLRQALKLAGQPLGSGDNGFVIFLIPDGYRTFEYEVAARELVGDDRNDWSEFSEKVRLANPPRKKGGSHQAASVFNLGGLSIMIAKRINEVPWDVRFAALAVMYVEPPSPRQINAARRLSGRSSIPESLARLLASKPQNIVLAAVLRKTVGEGEIAALDNLDRVEAEGPTLSELPGFEEAKKWAAGLVSDIGLWRKGKLAWKDMNRGALVSGPPGTGKTLFAAALANSIGFRLITTTVGEWQAAGSLEHMLKAMRESFESANNSKGSVLFIDEIDAVGVRPSRLSGRHGDQDWQVVVSEFLNLLSSVGEGVIVVGATNFPDCVDGAVLRAGRLESRFETTLPDTATRAAILAFYSGTNLHSDSLKAIAEDLDGHSAAELEALVRKARKVARDEDRELDISDLRALLPVKISYSVEQQFRLAVHEAGHALLAIAVGYATSATIHVKDSYDPSADAYLGGVTSYELVEDVLPTEAGLGNRIAVALAGMAAEAAVFADRSIGAGGTAGSDIERATSIARRMVASYGLGKTPIFLATVEDLGDRPLPAALEDEVLGILKNQYERVLAMLTQERERVVTLAGDAVSHRVVKIERWGIADAA
ncbi:ATP-dependent zinc metalloprotease FtsH [Neorhizobium galegae bv. officinalis]|uniref:ATP-dependent zinc metalloprotease FtsH n=1 Tax=Neorhizobium galegae bv. officinalis TaxID=323656 RepID=A0A0T7FKX3_NEOGA|nr:AAA family ATPase [Neorhizobium galegae]CDZ35644.1 ATP-dependent zinc metalloprotease FtsH [Neorhizobium galegae bv. officinalis]